MNKENADGQSASADEENPGEAFAGAFGEGNPRLKEREEESEEAEIDHMDVSVDFGAAIFEEAADILKRVRDGRGSVGFHRKCGGHEIVVNAGGVLMEYKDGENVTEEHADEDEEDPAGGEEST